MATNTRRNIYSLLPDGPEIAAFRRGVAAMQARSPDDPTSLLYQANIHGTDDPTPNPAWSQCQHGSFFFLSWHRMYIYWFERILQAASGDPSLTLPYWNYSDPAQRALPLVFRQPSDTSNPLYVPEPQRAPGINDGARLPASVVSFSSAFRFVNFLDSDGSGLSFGGQQVSEPAHFLFPHGQLESQPHDVVHTTVGGEQGWMSDPNFAAQDPIFWLHHANIDRLWKRWLDQGGGRANPTDNAWNTFSFTFFDENGQQVTMSGRDIVDTVGQLNYNYDDDPANIPTPSLAHQVTALALAGGTGAGPFKTTLGASEGTNMIELGTQPVKVTVPMEDATRNRVAAMVAAPVVSNRVVLNLEGIHIDRMPAVTYEVYINLPEDQQPDYQSHYYVGSLGFFAFKPHGGAHAAHMQGQQPGGKRSFDITGNVQALHQRGEWQGRPVEVTFITSGLLPPAGAESLSPEATAAIQSTAPVHIERVTITTA
ncbi:MAG: tyrosinase family protein [Ktedonobacteraceae bacterium]|nr:tyrosinase family protein [Ktedonobacteraceae bacterium]